MSTPSESDALRATLLRVAGDPAALAAACRANADAVRAHFPAWTQVPAVLRDKPEPLEEYVRGVVAVARTFADELGDPSLMRHVTGDDPARRWEAALAQARQDMTAVRLGDAIRRLDALAAEASVARGPAAEAYLPIVLGTLGECHFQAQQADRAAEPTRRALDRVRGKDADAELAYLGNLYEIHRYLGEKAQAAGYAEQLAEAYQKKGDAEQARRYRGQARLVREGEPRLRVVLDVGGKRYELDEVLRGIEGEVRFLFERDRLALGPSMLLTQQGQREAGAGRRDEALATFDRAIAADGSNPQPVYESAMTCAYLQRLTEAVARYERTEELAPGWFHCRTEGWLARQILSGRYPHSVFVTLRTVQDAPLEPAIRSNLVGGTLKKFPDLAPLHLEYGKMLADSGQRPTATAAFRRGLECAEEPDVRTRLLVDLAAAVEGEEERRQLCREAVALNGNLVAAATAAVVLAFRTA